MIFCFGQFYTVVMHGQGKIKMQNFKISLNNRKNHHTVIFDVRPILF